jgi:hypothetical protein
VAVGQLHDGIYAIDAYVVVTLPLQNVRSVDAEYTATLAELRSATRMSPLLLAIMYIGFVSAVAVLPVAPNDVPIAQPAVMGTTNG